MSHTIIKKSFLAEAAPLLLVIFIDSMGLGLVFPLVNALVMDPSSDFINSAISASTRSILFGTIIGIFMLCWFFGASFLGDLSDQIGRKKSLMICLMGGALGYLLSAVGVAVDSVTLLILGRMVAGFTAGSQTIAQAAIVDLSTSENKAENIGMILFAASLGFILGPLIGGLLSDSRLVSWFSFSTPLYFASIIALINAALLRYFFDETFIQTDRIKIKWHRAIEVLVSAFQHKKVRELSLILLVMIFGWSGVYSFASMFLLKKFAYSTTGISCYMALMAIGFGIGTSFLVNYCTKRFDLKKTVVVALLVAATGASITAIGSISIVWLCVLPTGAAIAVAYSVLLTIFSNQVDENSQGWVMGITGAIMAFAFGLNAFVLGFFAKFNPAIPMILSGTFMAISGYLMWFYRKRIS